MKNTVKGDVEMSRPKPTAEMPHVSKESEAVRVMYLDHELQSITGEYDEVRDERMVRIQSELYRVVG